MDFAFAWAGLAVGIAVGATGVGGGSLMTPILILFYGISPKVAVGTDLLYASISKAFGVGLHVRNRSLDWSLVAWMSLGSVPAALLTLALLHDRPQDAALDSLIKLTLAIAILVTATFTLVQAPLLAWVRRRGREPQGVPEHWRRPLTVLCGLAIGALVTISSVGAGVIGMMLLLLLYPDTPPIRLVGSDLAHAVLITAIAGAGHATLGTVDWNMLGALLIGALPGIWLGTRLAFRLDAVALRKTIAGLLLFVGASMLYKILS